MGTELYRFFFESNRKNSGKNSLFALQSLLQIFLRIKSLQEREQNKGGTKEVLIQNSRSGLDVKVKVSSNLTCKVKLLQRCDF